MAGIDPAKIKQIEGATYYVSEEPTLAEIALFPLPVNFKIVNSVDSTYKMVSFKADGTRLELTTDSSSGATNVITEDSATVAFTGNGTAGNPLSAESVGGGTTGDYIPLIGTEVGKPVTGDIQLDGNSVRKIGSSLNSNNEKSIYFTDDGLVGIQNAQQGSYLEFGDYASFNAENLSISLMIYGKEASRGIVCSRDFTANITDLDYVQKKYSDLQHSYSTEETLTGGTWIDDKDIYTITQLTADTPPTMETVFPTEVIGTYTVYKYTKP